MSILAELFSTQMAFSILGVAGWGVGGIEAEATMLGQVNLMWGHSSFNDRFLIITFFFVLRRKLLF